MSFVSKTIASVGAIAAPFIGTAALAGPYANVETNILWQGGDYDGALTELHVGYEYEASEDVTLYVQAGPAFVSVDGEENETEISGYLGAVAELSDNVEVYGELGLLTSGNSFNDELFVGLEAGATYRF